MTDRELLKLCKEWFDDIMDKTDRLTSGNVSHNGREIHYTAKSCAEFINEYLNEKTTMTQEEKQLLLIDLCGRLPYGVKGHFQYGKAESDVTISHIHDDVVYFRYGYAEWFHVSIFDFKPYLRPMSSMTEEEVKEFYDVECMDAKVGYIKPTWNWHFTINGIDWLNKKMFDYRGLIPKGVALEAPDGVYL